MISVGIDKYVKRCLIPNESDVLVGRGKGVQNSPGNIRYRHYILQYVPEYRRCKGKVDRDLVMRKIIHLVEASGGRFLRDRKPGGAKTATSAWEVLSEEEIVNKVKQAVKDMAHRRFRSKSRRTHHQSVPQPVTTRSQNNSQNSESYAQQHWVPQINPMLQQGNVQRGSPVSQATMGLLQMRMGHDLWEAALDCSLEKVVLRGPVQQTTTSSFGPPMRVVALGLDQEQGVKPTQSPCFHAQSPVGPPTPLPPHCYNIHCADRVRLT